MEQVIYNREKKTYETEIQYKEKELGFLYQSVLGHIILNLLISRKCYTSIGTRYEHSNQSIQDIKPFILKHQISMNEYQKETYTSFNDFFIRRVRQQYRPVAPEKEAFISPSDGKIMVHPIASSGLIAVKGHYYRPDEILMNDKLAKVFYGGQAVVIRLTADNCHRYIYPDSGVIQYQKEIVGRYHTVGPYSDGKVNVYATNYRKYDLVQTRYFGYMVMMEVGAMTIGKINNKKSNVYHKGAEKGYFSFGASSILLFFTAGQLQIDNDILTHSKDNIEVKIKRGEQIGWKRV